jgi:hypothetical protein
VAEPFLKALRGLWDRIRGGDAQDVEAERLGPLDQRVLELVGLQKSRFA